MKLGVSLAFLDNIGEKRHENEETINLYYYAKGKGSLPATDYPISLI